MIGQFLPHVGEPFALQLDGFPRCSAVLLACEASSPSSFSLTFEAEPGAPAEQGTYVVSATDLDPLPVFMVPVSSGVGGVILHAVFNTSSREAAQP